MLRVAGKRVGHGGREASPDIESEAGSGNRVRTAVDRGGYGFPGIEGGHVGH